MTAISKTRVLVLLGLLGAGLAIVPWSIKAQADGETAAAASPELKKIRQERVETLRQAVDFAQESFAKGVGPIEEVERLNAMLMDARLRAAASADERAAVLREALAVAKQQEEMATQRVQTGLGTEVMRLEAKAYRLGVEERLAEAGVK
jgi:outer membrane protein TolC